MKKNVTICVDLPETEVLILVKQGNQRAFQELYHRYSSKLYSNILRMVKSTEAADDILQIIFIKIWENRLSIDTSRPFKPYAYQIAENAVFDWFRKNSREQVLISTITSVNEPSYSHVENWLADKENRAILEEAVSQLPPRRREIYQLCKLEGYSYDQVSKTLGISTSTINDHIVKASKSLKDYLIQTRYYLPLLIFYFSASTFAGLFPF